MMGYKDNEEATKACIDENGFFHSGDKGIIDKDGYLKITGRIKELIITAGGENIAPVPIEDTFKGVCTCCSNIMLIGEGRRFMSAIITFKVEMDMANGGVPLDNLDPATIKYFKDKLGLQFKTSTELVSSKEVQ